MSCLDDLFPDEMRKRMSSSRLRVKHTNQVVKIQERFELCSKQENTQTVSNSQVIHEVLRECLLLGGLGS